MNHISYKIGRARHAAKKLRAVRERHGLSYPYLVRRLDELRRKHLYTLDEIFAWDLLAVGQSPEALEGTMSKCMTLRLQERFNPSSAEALTEDKSIFYTYCKASGLPTPELLAVLGPRLGWTAEGEVIGDDEARTRFFAGLSVDEIAIKPSEGVYGRGIRLLRREGEQWVDPDGRGMTARELVAALRQDEYESFVVQERTHSHPALRRLSNSDFLQTVRIVTAISAERGVEVLITNLKIIAGPASTDNYSGGTRGNLLADICLQTGRLGRVCGIGKDGLGVREHAVHPVTGHPFADFVVPSWPESCALARAAARRFLPLLTVGWDIAATADGPVLIEGNASWDPHNAVPNMATFRDYARRVLGPEAV